MLDVEQPAKVVPPDPDAPITVEPAPQPAAAAAAAPVAPARSRRAVIAGALGGAAALVAGRLASPGSASAAPGDSIILGSETNNAGNELTQVLSSSGDTSFRIVNSVGTALMGHVQATTGTGRGVYGRVDTPDGDGVQARNGSALNGNGAAIRAFGDKNNAVVATVTNSSYAFHGSGSTGVAIYGSGTQGGVNGVGYRGVIGETSSGGASAGVYGNNTGSGDTYGVYGRSTGTSNARGVFGDASGATGTNYGVYGQSASTSGRGVFGRTTTTTGSTYGVYGTSASLNGRGVYGEATSTTAGGNPVGVYGTTDGAGTLVLFIPVPSAGVVGNHGDDGAGSLEAGVWGMSIAPGSQGVRALNLASTGNSYGIWASTLSASGFAGKFTGNVDIEGTLSKDAGTFKIDHPLDPKNKWLYHSFVESPDMMNIYNGNVTTDANGEATISLPAWFGALNKDFRYQLTAIGKQAQAWVTAEVKNNAFAIKSDAANTKVSWQVTGVRQDAYANANRVQVEVAKTGADKGKYRQPEAFGQPASMGASYEGSGRAALDRHGAAGIKAKLADAKG